MRIRRDVCCLPVLALVLLLGVLTNRASGQGEGSTQFTAMSNAAEANLLTGASTYSIPIQIPPGRAGATPSLSLTYSSAGADGVFGQGWSLNIGEITRGRRHGVPRCVGDETTNEFVLSMPGVNVELVYKDGTATNAQYYARYDEGYIVAYADTVNNQWTVFDRAGNQYVFGAGASYRSWVGADVFMDSTGTNCSFTSRWSLKRIVTPSGARVEMTYQLIGNVPVIASIRYGNNPNANLTEHPFEITFGKVARLYPQTTYGLGVPETYSQLVNSITVSYRQQTGAALTPIRQYGLTYEETPFGGTASLASVQTPGLPTKTFTYASSEAKLKTADELIPIQNTGYGNLDSSLTRKNQTVGAFSNVVISDQMSTLRDMNGDGIPDRVDVSYQNPSTTNWEVHLGNGTGFATNSTLWDTSQISFVDSVETMGRTHSSGNLNHDTGDRIFYGTYATMDITGDGLPDFIDASPTSSTTPIWRVYPGYCSGAGCGFGAAISWVAPEWYLSRAKRQKRSDQPHYFDATYAQLIDMNGDGYLDFLRAPEPIGQYSGWPNNGFGPPPPPSGNWLVYFGTGSGFTSVPTSLAAAGYLSLAWSSYGGTATPTSTMVAMFDMNGDGLPDRVYQGNGYAYPGYMNGWMNPNTLSVDPNCQAMSSTCWHAWILSVELNNGRGFDAPVQSLMSGTSSAGNSGEGGYISADNGEELYRTASSIRNRFLTRNSIYDVNGDGLPDWVMNPGFASGPRVLFNVGGGRLESGANAFESTQATIDSVNFFTSIMPKRTLPGLVYPFRASESETYLGTDNSGSWVFKDVVDLDGDGLLEQLRQTEYNNNAANWRVARFMPKNDFEFHFGLLARVDEGNGVVNEMDYAPSTMGNHAGSDGIPDLPFNRWVVTATRRTDGLCVAPSAATDRFNLAMNPCIGQGHESVRYFDYEGGLFDKAERSFVGFRLVRETDTNGNVVETTHALSPGVAGKIIKQNIYAGSFLLRRRDWDWRVIPSSLDADRKRTYLKESSTIEYALSAGSAGLDVCSVTTNADPDEYGRVAQTCSMPCDAGNIGTPSWSYTCAATADNEVVLTDWANPTSGSEVRERPSRVTVKKYQGGSETLVSDTRFYYDGSPTGAPLALGVVQAGLVRRKESFLDQYLPQIGGGWIVSERRDYDSFGNPLKIYDAHNKFVSHSYDPTRFSLYVSETSYTNLAGVTSTSTYETDLRFGLVAMATSPNADTAQTLYDDLGRAVCEAQPGDTITACLTTGPFNATVEREFLFANPASNSFEQRHNQIIERRVEPNAPGGFLETVTFVDGLGRARFRKVERVIGAANLASLSTVIEGQTEFDSEGRPIKVFPPYEAAQATSAPTTSPVLTSYHPFNGLTWSSQGSTVPVVDPIGRPRVIDPPDQTLTTVYYEGALKRVQNAAGGEEREYRDSRGRVYKTESLVGSSVVMSAEYGHDAAGRVVSRKISNESNTLVSYRYDTMGRKIEETDPDAGGLWKYGYDWLGNLIYVDDPKSGQHTQTVYDDQSRVVQTCRYTSDSFVANASSTSCGTGGTAEATFSYDTGASNMVGRLRSVTDTSGSTTFDYDDLGRTTSEYLMVEGHYMPITSTYDRAGHVTSLRYGFEALASYAYNAAGQQIKLDVQNGGFTTNYVSDVDYDIFGRVEQISHANGVVEKKTYHPATQGFRLKDIVTKNASGTSHLNLAYSYNALGKIETINDLRNSTGPLSRNATYGYDSLGRLCSQSGATCNSDFLYDSIGNLTRKNGQTLIYNPSVGTAGPHHVDSYGSQAVGYDANGNRQTKARGGGGTETYTYDPFNRLIRIDVTGIGADTVQFKYNYAGKKVIKTIGSSPKIRYFGDFVEKSFEPNPQSPSGYSEIITKHFFIAGMRVASARQDNGGATPSSSPHSPLFIPKELVFAMGVVALLLVIKGAPRKTAVRIPDLPRPRAARVGGAIILILWIQIPAATLAPGVARSGGGGPPPNIVLYYHGDHLGSTQVVTDQSGNIELQLRYDVYGKEIIRANASGNPIPASNKIKHEYTGHEREQVSGLFYAGARFLDPELAQFLTVDPAGEFASPFAYGPWDPINGSDPSGTSWLGGLLAAIVVSLAVYGAGQALYGIAVGIATGNAWAIIGSLAGIAFAVAGAVISPAAVGIGLVNAAPSAQAFTAAGAGLGTYAAVQSWRGREVAWWTPIAGIAIGMAGLAYRAATSKSANGLAASSGGDEAADGLAKDQRRTVDWNNPDREATDTGRFRGPFPSDRATFQAANSEVLDQTLRSRTAGEWFFNVTADDKGYYYSPPRWWKGHHFMIENRPPALWYGHSHPISSSYSIIHPTDPSAGDFSGARNSGTPGVVVSAGAREYRVYSADYLGEYRGDLVRW